MVAEGVVPLSLVVVVRHGDGGHGRKYTRDNDRVSSDRGGSDRAGSRFRGHECQMECLGEGQP